MSQAGNLLVRLLVCLEIHVVTARRRTFDAWRASELVVRKMAYWPPTWIGFPSPVVHYAVRSRKKSAVGENGIVMWCLPKMKPVERDSRASWR